MDWLPGTLLLILGTLSLTTLAQSRAPEAAPSALCNTPEKDQELEACIQIGSRFIRRYLRSIRKGKNIDPCGRFVEFQECLQPLFDECPVLEDELKTHWIKSYHLFDKACKGESAYQARLQCFDANYGSVLMRRCDAFYKFNKKQKTKRPCHFLRESLRCKEALITSACQSQNDTGDYALHIFKLHEYDELKKHDCHVSRETQYEGFRYTEHCPANYTQALDRCEQGHLERKLPFMLDNDLIAQATKEIIRRACSDYRGYKECVRPIRETCPRGTKMYYEYLFKLRTYILKMDYICGDAMQEYKRNLKCYQTVFANHSLGECDPIWTRLSDLMPAVSAHEFYCRPNLTKTLQLQDLLMEVRECYERAFTVCDDNGRVIGELMTETFTDPRYLRYNYKPDCLLHAPAPPSDQPRNDEPLPSTDRWQVETVPDKVPDHHSRPSEDISVHTEDTHIIETDSGMTQPPHDVTTRRRRHRTGRTTPSPRKKHSENTPKTVESTSGTPLVQTNFFVMYFLCFYAVLHIIPVRCARIT